MSPLYPVGLLLQPSRRISHRWTETYTDKKSYRSALICVSLWLTLLRAALPHGRASDRSDRSHLEDEAIAGNLFVDVHFESATKVFDLRQP